MEGILPLDLLHSLRSYSDTVIHCVNFESVAFLGYIADSEMCVEGGPPKQNVWGVALFGRDDCRGFLKDVY